LINALVELGRCGDHGPSHRKRKKETWESGEVHHDVEVSIKDKPLEIEGIGREYLGIVEMLR
jgi:hypothetical protein